MSRAEYDNYPTPPWCFQALEPYLDFSGVFSFLEPCAGDGRIIKWVASKTVNNNFPCYCMATDVKGEYSTGNYNADSYLNKKYSQTFDLIITNPPYSLGLEFAEKMLKDARIVMSLFRLDFLATQIRKSFFRENPLHGLYVLSKRPAFRGRTTDRYDYAWFVWAYPDGMKINLPKAGIHHI